MTVNYTTFALTLYTHAQFAICKEHGSQVIMPVVSIHKHVKKFEKEFEFVRALYCMLLAPIHCYYTGTRVMYMFQIQPL